MDVVVREIEERDEKAVEKLIVDTIYEYVPTGPFNRSDYDSFGKYHREREGEFYVAELNRGIVGCVGVMKIDEGIMELRRMYIKKGLRRKGIGKRLYEKVIEFCKERNYSKVVLFTFPFMKEAVEFYKKEGFVEFKREGEKIFFEKDL
jgi:GNAT superfamily N-acetyltransferase